MATKAETARAQAQQKGTRTKTKKPAAKRSGAVPKSVRARAIRERDGGTIEGSTGERNLQAQKKKTSAYELEGSAKPRPSRKSTRKGATGVKPASQLRRRAMRAVRSPKARAQKAAAAEA